MKTEKHLYLLIVLLLIVIPVGCQVSSSQTQLKDFQTVQELREFFRWSEYSPNLVSAHRGGPQPGFPENCLETFDKSLEYGPCIIECDVMLSKDSVLVMMHDYSVDRTTTGTGKVTELTYDYLKTLHLKDNDGTLTNYTIPTFIDVLNWSKGKAVVFTVDVKRGVPARMIVEAVRKTETEPKVVIITYNAESAALYTKIANDLMLSVTIRNQDEFIRLKSAGVPLDNMVAFVGTRTPNPEHLASLHEKGIYTILGTMGNLDGKAAKKGFQVYQELFKAGADILSTDNVPLVSEAIQTWN